MEIAARRAGEVGMMRRLPISGISSAVLAIALHAAPASADPIPVPISGGTVTVTGSSRSMSIYVWGPDGFQLSAGNSGMTGFPTGWCFVCPAGDTVSLAAWVTGATGTLNYGDRQFTLDPAGGQASAGFSAGLFTLPEVDTYGTRVIRVRGTGGFTVGGFDPSHPGFTFSGDGWLEATFTTVPLSFACPDCTAKTNWWSQSMQFTFDDPAATPEPSTLLLIGGGLALVVRRYRSAART